MKPSPVAAEAGRPISWTRACPRHVRILRIATPTCAWLDFPKSTTGPNRWNELKIEQAACGGWESPAALRHIQPGRWMAIPGGCAACTAGDPDGTRTDGPQAADLHCTAHSTSPTTRLRSPAVRRCDNYHGIVQLDRTWDSWSHLRTSRDSDSRHPPSAPARDCLE